MVVNQTSTKLDNKQYVKIKVMILGVILSIIVFVLILTIIVFVHELGHFYFAKKFGVKVHEFGLGLPPRAVGKTVGETIYSLNWLPLGGFVSLKGEEYNEEEYQNKDQDSFLNKKPWQKAVILVAGVFMNIIFGILAFQLFLGMNGYKSQEFLELSNNDYKFGVVKSIPNTIGGFSEDSPAEKSGLRLDDRVVALMYQGESVRPTNIDELRSFLQDKSDKTVQITVNRPAEENATLTFNIVPTAAEDTGHGTIGVYLNSLAMFDYTNNKIMAGVYHSFNMLDYTFSTLGHLIGISVKEGDIQPVASSVSGPLGVLGVVNVILNLDNGMVFSSLLNLFGLISISLAVMNLLPIPALDGGRLVFTLYEAVTGKLPNPKLEGVLVKWSFLFLIGLMILVTIKDVFMLPQFF